jgi:hypothetical protein
MHDSFPDEHGECLGYLHHDLQDSQLGHRLGVTDKILQSVVAKFLDDVEIVTGLEYLDDGDYVFGVYLPQDLYLLHEELLQVLIAADWMGKELLNFLSIVFTATWYCVFSLTALKTFAQLPSPSRLLRSMR